MAFTGSATTDSRLGSAAVHRACQACCLHRSCLFTIATQSWSGWLDAQISGNLVPSSPASPINSASNTAGTNRRGLPLGSGCSTFVLAIEFLYLLCLVR